MGRTAAWIVALVLCAATSGCLRDDIFPEPFEWKPGEVLEGRGDSVKDVIVPERAERLRFRLTADFSRDTPILGPQAGLEVRVRDPQGDVALYRFQQNGETRDTYGGGVGGPWRVTFSDPQGGARYGMAFDWFVPKYDDWAWWEVWKD